MPQLKQVKHIVERMKNMSPQLVLSANKNGLFVLKVETESATVSTNFQNLQVWSCSQEDREEKVSVTIDIKTFCMFMAWDVVHPDGVKCNILKDRMINLFLYLADHLKIHYFLPSISV